MFEYEEDFYHEPSEFELYMDQIKENLMKSIKNEFVTEMERLREENLELQTVKKRL